MARSPSASEFVSLTLEFYNAIRAIGETLDEDLELFGGDLAGRDRRLICDGDVIECVAGGVRSYGDEDGAVPGSLKGARQVVEEELPAESSGEIQ